MKAINAMRSSILILFVMCVSAAWAQQSNAKPATAQPAAPPSVSRVLHNQFSSAEKEFVDAADAMPEDRYNFAPTNGEFKGVRTFAQQVKHVAAVNYIVGAAITGVKPPDTNEEKGPDSLQTKAQIVQYLKDSFAYAHKSIDNVTAENQTALVPSPFGPGTMTRLGMGVILVAHPFDHYGQMVEYLRMNGIIPPASRPR